MREESADHTIGVVIIGRNEGERLIACLNSLALSYPQIVYVDSGSTDGSIEAAKARGAEIVALDMSKPFTAARARNAGYEKLKEGGAPEFIQFIDGDCTLAPGWLERGAKFLRSNEKIAAVAGDVAERFPEKTLFNRIINEEWRGPQGPVEACGGIAMMRATAFDKAGAFREDLIAGEEPELCVRLRQNGWTIFRLNAPMAFHDADMKTLGQWLKRARRAGYAFAEVSTLHRGSPQRIWAREAKRPLFWTGAFAAIVIGGAIVHPLIWALLALFPLQIFRIAARDGLSKDSLIYASLITLQKPWEAAGVLQFWFNHLTGRHAKLIEYRAHGAAEK